MKKKLILFLVIFSLHACSNRSNNTVKETSGNPLNQPSANESESMSPILKTGDTINYLIDGRKIGKWIFFRSDKLSEGMYRDDRREGQWVFYNDCNDTASVVNYEHDTLNGAAVYYDHQKKIIRKGTYVHGVFREEK